MIRAQRARAEVYGSTPPRAARAPLSWRAAAGLATACAVAALALVVVQWGWRWFGPAPTPAPALPSPERYAPAIVAAAPFGQIAGGATGVQPAATTLQGETRLLGVLAEREGGGQALFRLSDRGPVLIGVGEKIADEVTLLAVRPDGVRIRDHGVERDLSLRPIASPPPAPGPSAARAGPAGTALRAACLAPTGFKGGVYRLNAELLTGIASQPQSWSAFLTPVAGGLAIREQTGLAPLLGMKAGDRMTQANGIALAGVEDVLVAFVKPLIANQSVHVLGLREGKPAEWLFVNAGACP